MGINSAGEARALNGLLNSVYVGLHTAQPTTGNEVSTSGTGYARQALAYGITGSGEGPSVAANNATIQFPTATGGWGTLTHVGIWSAVSAGTLVGWMPLTTAKIISVDDVVRFLTGKLTVTLD